MDQRREHMKIDFECFRIQKPMIQTVRAEKVDEKSGVICLKFAIYIYASERFRYALSENGIVYYAMTYCLGDIRV